MSLFYSLILVFGSLSQVQASDTCSWTKLEDIVLTPQSNYQTTSKVLSVEELKSDFDCIRLVFQRTYVANEFYLAYGFSIEKKLEEMRNKLTPQTQEQMIQSLLKEIHLAAYDLHAGYYIHTPTNRLSFTLPKFIPVFIKQTGSEFKSCDGLTYEKVLLPNARITQKWVGQFLEVPKTVKCATKWGYVRDVPVAKMTFDTMPDPGAEFTYKTTSAGIFYIRFRGFNFGTALNEDLKKLASIIADTTNEKPIILDLRGTKGGSPLFPQEFTSQLLTTDKVLLNDPKSKTKMSIMSAGGMANYFFFQNKLDLEAGNPAAAAVSQQNYAKFSAIAGGMVKAGMPFDAVDIQQTRWPADAKGAPIAGKRQKQYSKPVAVLIDKGCVSACEAFAFWIQDLPNVYLIGTPTLGTAHFGTPAYFMLPNSKVVIRAAIFSWDIWGKNIEGIGVLPDFYVPDGRALEKAVSFINDQKP